MNRIIGLAAIMLACAGGLPLSAAVISEIHIGGKLRKTKDSTVLDIIRFELGDEIHDDDEKKIRRRLKESGLFVDESTQVELNFTDTEEAILDLELEDRFSLIPVPIVAGGDDGIKGGLFLMDSNFLGTGDSVFAGGLFGEGSQYLSISYTDRHFRGSSWDLGAVFLYSYGDETIVSVDGDTDLFDLERRIFGARFLAALNADPWTLSISGGISRRDYDFQDDWLTAFEPGLGLSYRKVRFGRFMGEGFIIHAKYDPEIYSRELDPSHTLKAEIVVQKLLNERIQGELLGKSSYYRGEDRMSPGISSSIISNKVRADQVFMGRAGLQFVLADFSWAYLGLPVSYEAGVLDGVSGEDEFFHGPSAGLTLSLKKVAIPAVLIKYGWNVETSEGKTTFSIGFSN